MVATCGRHVTTIAAAALLMSGLAGLAPVLETVALSRAVDIIAAPNRASASAALVLFVLLIAGARIAAGWLQILSGNTVRSYQRASRREEYAKVSEELEICRDLAMYENGASQDIVHLGVHGAEHHRVLRMQAATMLVQGILATVFLGSAIAAIGWRLGLTAVVTAAAASPFHLWNGAQAHRSRVSASPLERKLGYLRHVLTHPVSMAELMASRATRPLRNLAGALIAAISDVERARDRKLTRSNLVITVIPHLVTAVVVVFSVSSGAVKTAGELSLVIVGFGALQASLAILLQGAAIMREASLERARVTDLQMKIREHAYGRPAVPSGPATRAPSVTFDAVSFRYSPSAPWCLSDFSLHIETGETVCLMGPNGSGKTTALKLVTGVLRPTRGAVLVDGRDVRDYDPDELAALLRLFVQVPVRLEASLRNNIDLFKERSVGEIERAAQRAHVDRIAARMPHGLETEIAQQFGHDEHGQALSGGEWQRVMFARLLMGGDGLFILDEPTAALDTTFEATMVGALEGALHSSTALIVTHRWPLLRLCDRIAVMRDGRLLELGTHAQLRAAGGQYAALVEQQRQSLSFLYGDVCAGHGA